MIQISRWHGEVQEKLATLQPGILDRISDFTVPVGRYITATCFDNDLGGEILLFDSELFDSLDPDEEFSAELMAQGELLHEIGQGGIVELQLKTGPDTREIITATHIPANWN